MKVEMIDPRSWINNLSGWKRTKSACVHFKENNTDDRILIFLVRITYRQQAPYEVVSDVYKMFFCLVTGIFLGRVFFVENDRCFLGKTGSLIMANRIKVVGELLVPIPLYQRAFSSPEPVFVFGTRMISARNSWRP